MNHHAYEAVIGLEVHCQLLTASKAFSPDAATYGADPNEQVDPISLGHPGTLPVLNEKVVDATLRMGLATHCTIAPRSVLARKHYFYPDLPKGYQISQYDTPICYDGHIDIEPSPPTLQAGAALNQEADEDAPLKQIRLTRIHIEEDAGKSIHDQDPHHTLLDYNRCGVPLIEIVSEPDLRSPQEAVAYLQKIRQIVRYLGICDGNMEQGSLRCDANISVRRKGQRTLGTKAEIKNMNSFRHVERALEYEILRQVALAEGGSPVVQETRLWDADQGETRSMRSKEEAHDYRYFPDPDLVPIVVTADHLESLRADLPELPQARAQRYVDDFGLPAYDADVLTGERAVADYFEATVEQLYKRTRGGDTRAQAKAVSNVVMTDVLRVINERGLDVATFPVEPSRLAMLVHLRLDDTLGSSAAQEVFEYMLEDNRPPKTLAKAHNLLQVSDASAIRPVVQRVLKKHSKQVKQYQSGKKSVIGFFIGQVMRSFDGSPDPKLVRSLLQEHLKSMKS